MEEQIQDPKPEDQKELTPEEVLVMKTKMIEFYKSEMELLTPREEYERTISDIEEHRLRRLQCVMQRMQLQSQSSKPEEERKLKKD